MEMGGGESSGVQLSAHGSVDFTSVPLPCCTLFLPVVAQYPYKHRETDRNPCGVAGAVRGGHSERGRLVGSRLISLKLTTW